MATSVEAGQITVILADADVDRRIELKKMLFQNPDMEVVGETEDAENTLKMVQEERPELLLLSVPLGEDGSIDDLVEEAAVEAPQTEIILLAESMEDSEQARELQRRGARDTLVRPIDSDELMDHIDDIVTLARRRKEKLTEIMTGQAPGTDQRTGKVISIFSTKGGVGRSLCATNLACMIRKLTNRRVALVDLDLQFGDAAIMLDMTPTTMIASLARDCKEEERVDYDLLERYMHTHEPSGIDLLAAPPRPEEADYVTDADTRKILQSLKQHYSFVVVDTSSQVTDPVIASLENSDLILLLLTLELPTIKDGKLMLELIDNLGLSRDLVHILMNRNEPGSEIELQEIEEALDQEVLGGLPSEGHLIMPSVNEGTPIVLSQPESRFAVQMEEITRTIIGDILELEDEIIEEEEVGAGGELGLNLATMGPRFMGGFIDFLLGYVVGSGLFGVLAFLLPTVMEPPLNMPMAFASGALAVLTPIFYYSLLGSLGNTPGKALTGLRVVHEGGDAAGFGAHFIRSLLLVFLEFSLLGIPLLWILIDRNNQALHDLVAGTFVVQERTPETS